MKKFSEGVTAEGSTPLMHPQPNHNRLVRGA